MVINNRKPRTQCGALHPGVMSAYRTLRVYSILCEESSPGTPLTSRFIIDRLEHPPCGIEPVETGRKSLYSAINSLRLAGYEIASHGKAGYSLESRYLSDADIADILCVIKASSLLSCGRIQDLTLALLELGSPTLQARFEEKSSEHADAAAKAPESQFSMRSPGLGELAQKAISTGSFIQVEIFASSGADTFAHAGALYGPVRFQPLRLVEKDQQHYMVGMLQALPNGIETVRTIGFDRVKSASLLYDGAILTYIASESHT